MTRRTRLSLSLYFTEKQEVITICSRPISGNTIDAAHINAHPPNHAPSSPVMSIPCRQAARLAIRSPRKCPRAFPATSQTNRRAYHSYDHPDPTTSFNPQEHSILSAAYKHVPEHGFTQQALALGARDAGYLDISTSVLPDGPFSLVRYHLVTKREGLAAKSKEILGQEPEAGVGAKVERITWERLLENETVIDRWQEVGRREIPPSPPRLQTHFSCFGRRS